MVTYSNEAKRDLLGVDEALLAQYGAVSEQVAQAMAEGVLGPLRADLAVAITGVAGPGGGSVDKPIGLVHFATAIPDGPTETRTLRLGDIGREPVRLASVGTALEMLMERLMDER
jgi:nicotinamide-nucleotide amidase